jgi:hypothetical protein
MKAFLKMTGAAVVVFCFISFLKWSCLASQWPTGYRVAFVVALSIYWLLIRLGMWLGEVLLAWLKENIGGQDFKEEFRAALDRKISKDARDAERAGGKTFAERVAENKKEV